jgi:hypothetical protein
MFCQLPLEESQSKAKNKNVLVTVAGRNTSTSLREVQMKQF